MISIVAGVMPAAAHERHQGLLDALQQVLPVRFEARDFSNFEGVEAAIFLEGGGRGVAEASAAGIPGFFVAAGESKEGFERGDGIRFSKSAATSQCLHEQEMPERQGLSGRGFDLKSGAQVVATKGGRLIWTYRPPSDGAGGIDAVAVAPGNLGEGEFLADFFRADRFMEVLPIIEFLKRVVGERGWRPSARRACLVFDDPNLSRPSYGCIRFCDLVKHAEQFNYHASIGTIPLDAGRFSRRVAEFFRSHSSRLSLAVHGNDHTFLELGLPQRLDESLGMLEQAIRRISILEDRSGVKICRVMEPPHGVVDPSMFGPLAMLGYEAVLVTIERFLQANRSAKMSSSFGIRMVEHVADGLALIPRLKVAPNWRSNVLLAEVLQQPIVIVGHHYDAAHGMDLIAEMAGFINNLGTVRWHNLTSIARAHYSYSIEGAIMSVSMSSRRVMIEVPHQVRSLVIHRPWIEGGDVQRLEVWTDGGPKEVLQNLNCRAQSDPFEVTPGSKIQISSPYPNVLDPGKFPRRPVHYSPYLRRMLTEIRDRISPLTGGHRAPGSGA